MQWVLGVVFQGIRKPRREADHSFPPSTEVKNEWSCTSTPTYAFMACRVTTFSFTCITCRSLHSRLHYASQITYHLRYFTHLTRCPVIVCLFLLSFSLSFFLSSYISVYAAVFDSLSLCCHITSFLTLLFSLLGVIY
jgi:hypothetical protein